MKKDKKKRSDARRGFDAQLLAYCAVAAGGALATAQPVAAATVYSGVKNIAIGENGTVALDLDGNGVIDFNALNTMPVALTGGEKDYSKHKANFITPEDGNAIAFSDGILQNFITGAPIPNDAISWLTAGSVDNDFGFNLDYGNIINDSAGLNICAQGPFGGKKGFIGVKFQINYNTHYGWIRYAGIGVNNTLVSGTIVDWAYEDAPYTAISPDPVCSMTLLPGRISKLLSLVMPITGMVIRGDNNAIFTKSSELDWGTDTVKTLFKILINPKTILAVVRVKPLLMQDGELFKVTVDDCAGSLSVNPF